MVVQAGTFDSFAVLQVGITAHSILAVGITARIYYLIFSDIS